MEATHADMIMELEVTVTDTAMVIVTDTAMNIATVMEKEDAADTVTNINMRNQPKI